MCATHYLLIGSLVFGVAEGWEPLCAFLDVQIPDEPFHHHNLRADFWEVLAEEPA
jgi:hypothetical protein